jgi:hypothetical protein
MKQQYGSGILIGNSIISPGSTNYESIKERHEKLEKHLEELNKIKEEFSDLVFIDVRKGKWKVGRSLSRSERRKIDSAYAERIRESNRRLRDKRKNLGLCTRCSRYIDDDNFITCSKCRNRARSYRI